MIGMFTMRFLVGPVESSSPPRVIDALVALDLDAQEPSLRAKAQREQPLDDFDCYSQSRSWSWNWS